MDRLADHVDLLTGFPFKSASYTSDGSGTRLIRGDNVIQGQLRWENAARWPTDQQDDIDRYRLEPADVVLAMDRPWIEAGLKYARIGQNDVPALLVQRVARLRARADLHQGFLFYLIGSRAFTDHVLAVQTGTAVPHISGKQILEFQFRLAPYTEQEAIASILGALDDKINLNRRMNETLEAMARVLFKDWFVDFGPTRAKLEGREPYLAPELWALFPDRLDDEGKPEGWAIEPLFDHARLISGGTPKTDVSAYWNGPIPWASAKDVSQCGDAFLIETERNITQLGLEKSSTKLIPKNATVIVARGATTGRYCLLGAEMAMNQTCYALSSTKQRPFWLNCAFGFVVQELVHSAHGSVFNTITTKTIERIQLTISDPEVIDRFEETISSLFSRIRLNLEASRTLTETRDLLLPKLMSGEIRVRDAERMVEDVV